MKLSLSVLKKSLISKGLCDDEWEIESNEWIKNNISDEEVSIREWLDKFSEYWNKFSDDYGDSMVIEEILKDDYNLNENEIDEVMCMYWDCENIDEYIKDYK